MTVFGRRKVIIDCQGVSTPEEFWRRYVEATNPQNGEVFGRNLSAFFDAVERGGPGWPGDVDLVFVNSSALANLTGPQGRSFLDAFADVANSITSTRITLS